MAAKDLAQHVAATVAAAWVLSVAAPTPVVGLVASIAALAGMATDHRSKGLKAVIARATDSALADLEASHEFTDADLDRARVLLDAAGRKVHVDGRSFARAARGGDPDAELAQAFLLTIDFAGDDHGPRRALELALTAVVRTCRTHDATALAINQELLIEAAGNHGIKLELLKAIKADTTDIKDDTAALLLNQEAMRRALYEVKQELSEKERLQVQQTTLHEMTTAIAILSWCGKPLQEIIQILTVFLNEGITTEEAVRRMRG